MFNKIKLAVALMLVPMIEVGTTIALTKTLGAVVTFSIFAISNVIGLVLLWFRWQEFSPRWSEYWSQLKAAEQLSEEERERLSADAEHQKKTLEMLGVLLSFLLGIVLLLTPGFVTDLLAFYWLRVVARNTSNPPTLQAN